MFFLILVCLVCASRSMFDDQILVFTKSEIKNRSLFEPTEEQLFNGAVEGMLRKLSREFDDNHSLFVPGNSEEEKRFNEILANKFEGIGVSFYPNTPKGTFRVFYPLPGSPADKAGIQPGDSILEVDGLEVSGLTTAKLTERIKGPLGTTVKLKIVRLDETEPREIVVSRASIQQGTVFGETLQDDGRQKFTLGDAPEIAYIHISQFIDDTAGELQDAILSLPKSVCGLILDLRGNPGGSLKSCVNVADMFVKPGQYHDIVTTRARGGIVREAYQANVKTLTDLPMVVLVDGESASASEIVSACLQDYGRAKIIGTRSFGKGTVQEVIPLPMGKGQLKLTTSSFWRPSERNINRGREMTEADDWGVSPDPGLGVPLEREQMILTYNVRSLRSNVRFSKLGGIMDDYLKNGIADFPEADLDDEEENGENELVAPEDESAAFLIENKDENENVPDEGKVDDEVKGGKAKKFVPAGNAPYFDPQLDKAIEVLRGEITVKHAAVIGDAEL